MWTLEGACICLFPIGRQLTVLDTADIPDSLARARQLLAVSLVEKVTRITRIVFGFPGLRHHGVQHYVNRQGSRRVAVFFIVRGQCDVVSGARDRSSREATSVWERSVVLYSVSKFQENMSQALNVLIPSHNLLIQFHLFSSAGRSFVHSILT
jgi:hypothetical protein